MKYGNSTKTVKHVAKVGVVFGVVLMAIFFAVGYVHNKLNEPNSWFYLLGFPFLLTSTVPFLVWVTSLLNVEITDRNISLLICNKYRYNPHSVDDITAINVGRGLLSIYFEDGSSIRTLGMYIPEYYRLVKDVRSARTKPLKVSSDWLSIN